MNQVLKIILISSIAMDLIAAVYFFTIIDEIGFGIYLTIVLILASMTGLIGVYYLIYKNKNRRKV
ncbi:hypothetical protein [Bacillus sp. AK128]